MIGILIIPIQLSSLTAEQSPTTRRPILEQTINPRTGKKHWPAIISSLLLLSFILSGSVFLLVHYRDPQTTMARIAMQNDHQTIDAKSIVTLSADQNHDQVVLDYTKNNHLIVQFQQRAFGGYVTRGYHMSAVSAHTLNRPYQLENKVAGRPINNFVYGFLKPKQTAPTINGKSATVISQHGQRLFYAFTSPAKSAQVQFQTK